MNNQKISVDEVVPWGKTFQEYQQFFSLQGKDLDQTIACFGDGASSFNAELTQLDKKVVSFDPIYQYGAIELEKRFLITLEQFKLQINYEKSHEDSMVQQVVSSRETATRIFLSDLDKGKRENRYVSHLLPNEISFGNNFFDLGLCSHFLLMYDDLGIDFHIQSVAEMMRVCKEVRIYPTINIFGQESKVLHPLVDFLRDNQFVVNFRTVQYKFNVAGGEVLIIHRPEY